MSKSELPNRVPDQARDLAAIARRHANEPEAVRHAISTSLISRSRQEWRGTEEEIFAASGYQGADEYWQVALSEPMKATFFAHLLALHQLDPTERLSEFDRRSKAQQLLDAALRLALEARETFFIKGNNLGTRCCARATQHCGS